MVHLAPLTQPYYISLSQNIQGSVGGKPDFFVVLVKVVYLPILGEPFSFFACLHGEQDMGVAVANARFTGRWLCAVDGKVGYLIVILQSGHGKSAASRIGIRLVVDQKTAVSFLEMFISCIYANGIFRMMKYCIAMALSVCWYWQLTYYFSFLNNMYRNILSLKHDMNNHMQLGRLFLLT